MSLKDKIKIVASERDLSYCYLKTAEEFLTISDEFEVLETRKQEEVVTKTMIEFAKLHVEEALKEAYNNSEMRVSENDTNEIPSFTDNYDDGYVTITVSKDSILNAYPLENVK